MSDNSQFNDVTRELLRYIVETMADVAALKMIVLTKIPDGRMHLETALQASRQQTQPFLDTIQRANDQELLGKLAAWKGPVH